MYLKSKNLLNEIKEISNEINNVTNGSLRSSYGICY